MATVAQIKTAPLCKICKSAERARIEALLLLRSRGATDEGGQRVNLEYVLRRMEEWGIPNPTKENVTVHWQKHCAVVDEGEAAEAAEQLDEVFGPLLEGGPSQVDVDGVLKAIFKVGAKRFFDQVRAGKVAISPDQMVKIADTLERRRQSDAQAELLRSLGGGLGNVFGALAKRMGGDLPAPQPPAAELTEGDDGVEVAEIIESG